MPRRRAIPLAAAAAIAAAAALAACAGQDSSDLRADAGAVGQAVTRPPTADAAGQHVVVPGETLSGIAERYGLGLSKLARANRIEPPYEVQAGRVLTVPPIGPAPRPLATETVRRGDTLAAIAARHGLKLGDILAANPGLDPGKLRAGQRVRIPGDVEMPTAPPLDPEEVEQIRTASLAKPPSLSGDGFVWPVRGRLVSRFGDKPDGTRNDGLNIAAPAGTAVLAAENGVVVYAGDRLPGYGKMLLIRHAQDFTTAYAHNQSLLVRIGDKVRRGQKIATVGVTGTVRQPQLHFELRAGRTPIDPQRYLEPDPGQTRVAASSTGADGGG